MAYYPGNYYRTAFQHIGDYYSQGLFSATTPWPHDFDPYTDSSQLEGHDRHHERSPPRSTSHHRPYPTRNSRNSPPLSSSPPRSSPAPPNHHPEQLPLAPPSPTQPPPALPSPSYLDIASKPSKTLSEPTRKLLVLDLNGALLLRSPRIPKSHRGQYQRNQHPAPRRVIPRPYLTSLRAYIFAPQTRVWLDVMVWSSAQPHSVEDMVLHAFGSDQDQLVAIWARDTLGLEEDHYYRKVQTIKDLEKPWAALTPQQPSPKSNHELQPPSSQTQTWTGHSAATTILLDDSHAKAARQPHNHLCVPEYTRARRNADLAALKQAPSARAAPAREAEDGGTSPPLPPPLPPQDDNTKKPRKRKRKRETEQEEEQEQQLPSSTTLPANDDSHADAPAAAPAPEPALDETLLAVVGVLHAARLQSSIAAWIRAGALLSERDAVWCDDPELVRMWALRGREAMRELRLEIKHGVVPDP